MLGECFEKSERFDLAVEKYESIKRKIQHDIVFDKPIMLINILNSLGNCYLRLNEFTKA